MMARPRRNSAGLWCALQFIDSIEPQAVLSIRSSPPLRHFVISVSPVRDYSIELRSNFGSPATRMLSITRARMTASGRPWRG